MVSLVSEKVHPSALPNKVNLSISILKCCRISSLSGIVPPAICRIWAAACNEFCGQAVLNGSCAPAHRSCAPENRSCSPAHHSCAPEHRSCALADRSQHRFQDHAHTPHH
eukprot:3744365-Amphidinium_carterae.1